jgi:hypothetical protein
MSKFTDSSIEERQISFHIPVKSHRRYEEQMTPESFNDKPRLSVKQQKRHSGRKRRNDSRGRNVGRLKSSLQHSKRNSARTLWLDLISRATGTRPSTRRLCKS